MASPASTALAPRAGVAPRPRCVSRSSRPARCTAPFAARRAFVPEPSSPLVRRDAAALPTRVAGALPRGVALVPRAGPSNEPLEEIDIDSIGAPGDDPKPAAPEERPPRISAPAPDPAPVVSSPSRSSSESNGILRGGKGGGKRRADSTDAVASFLTRRFGLAGGLAWLGILTFGVVSEQLKTRREVREATENTRDVKDAEARVSASGVVFTELKIGGGERPKPGYLVAADVLATVEGTGAVLVDTKRQRRQLVFTYGRAQGPITRGVTEMVGEMNQGGRRVFDVPPSLGFGAEGATLADGSVVPPNATIRYDVELTRVSVPPS
jgi:FKBP-type peptidyl-prolyl cis-trans isomerase